DELQGADEPLCPVVVRIEAGGVKDLADPRPPRRQEQQRRLTHATPVRIGHDSSADLPDDDDEGKIIKKLEPCRLATSALARTELWMSRPAHGDTSAVPCHRPITAFADGCSAASFKGALALPTP